MVSYAFVRSYSPSLASPSNMLTDRLAELNVLPSLPWIREDLGAGLLHSPRRSLPHANVQGYARRCIDASHSKRPNRRVPMLPNSKGMGVHNPRKMRQHQRFLSCQRGAQHHHRYPNLHPTHESHLQAPSPSQAKNRARIHSLPRPTVSQPASQLPIPPPRSFHSNIPARASPQSFESLTSPSCSARPTLHT